MPLHFLVFYSILLLPCKFHDFVFQAKNAQEIKEKFKIKMATEIEIETKYGEEKKEQKDSIDENELEKEKKEVIEISSQDSRMQYLSYFIIFLVVAYVLQYSCLSHPFLLADNRYVLVLTRNLGSDSTSFFFNLF